MSCSTKRILMLIMIAILGSTLIAAAIIPISTDVYQVRLYNGDVLEVSMGNYLMDRETYSLYTLYNNENAIYEPIINSYHFNRQIDSFVNALKQKNYSKQEILDNVILTFQNMEYVPHDAGKVYTLKHVLEMNESDCDERVLYAAGILHKFGFDVGIAHLLSKDKSVSAHHAVLVISCDKGDMIVELTTPEFKTYSINLEYWGYYETYQNPIITRWNKPNPLTEVEAGNAEYFKYNGKTYNVIMFKVTVINE